MNFKKIAPATFLGLVIGVASVYASYPYMSVHIYEITKPIVKEQAKVIDKRTKPAYPVGTFEHEHKRTI